MEMTWSNKALEPTAVKPFILMSTDNITSPSSATPHSTAVAQLGRSAQTPFTMQKFIAILLSGTVMGVAVRTLAEGTNLVATSQEQSPVVTSTNTLQQRSAADMGSPSPHPQGTLAPLPADYSLGASSLQEREDICEAVFRFVAAKYRKEVCFIGFENIVNDGTIRHDPTSELLKRLHDLTPPLMPASRANDARTPDGMPKGVVYWVWGISRDSKNEARVVAKVARYLGGSSVLYRYRVVRDDGKWKTTEEKEEWSWW
jgi:hypothetical protein